MNLKLKQKIVLAILAFLLVFIPSVSKATSCSCANGSVVYYTGVGEAADVSTSADCDQTCANRGANLYFYNASTFPSSVTKTPTTPPANPTGTSSPQTPVASNVKYPYTPMEAIPGFPKTGSMIDYVLQIYQFGLWTIGIAAVFMISIGAFMYITSAGNTSQMGKAKEVIFDAIIGVILALTSYVLLNTINPALVQIGGGDYSTTGGGGTGGGGGSGGGGGGGGSCTPVTSGPCSVDQLTGSCFDGIADLSKISSLCNAESGGVNIPSTVDICTDRTTYFSCGALQVNLTCACKGTNAFTGAEPSTGCANSNCTGPGINYTSCTSQTCSGSGNITAACKAYKEHSGNKYDTWTKNSTCGFS